MINLSNPYVKDIEQSTSGTPSDSSSGYPTAKDKERAYAVPIPEQTDKVKITKLEKTVFIDLPDHLLTQQCVMPCDPEKLDSVSLILGLKSLMDRVFSILDRHAGGKNNTPAILAPPIETYIDSVLPKYLAYQGLNAVQQVAELIEKSPDSFRRPSLGTIPEVTPSTAKGAKIITVIPLIRGDSKKLWFDEIMGDLFWESHTHIFVGVEDPESDSKVSVYCFQRV